MLRGCGGGRQQPWLARRAVTCTFVSACFGLLSNRPATALEVEQRLPEEKLQRALYAPPPPQIQSYAQQLSDAQPFKTMRGVWRLKEFNLQGKEIGQGTLTFRGAGGDVAEKGSVVYEGDTRGSSQGRGPWLLKAYGFGRSQTGMGGIIEKKALWKLRRGGEGTFTYAGRVNVPSFSGARPDATIKGDVIQLINGGKTKGGSEKAVGRFEAELVSLLTAADEEAAVDSAAAGGAPESLEVVCIDSTAAVSGIPQSCRR